MNAHTKKILCIIATLAAAFLVACPGAGTDGGDELIRTFTFDSGGAYHIQGLGAWRVVLTGDGILSISHDTRGDIVDYGDFTLTNDEASRLWAAVDGINVPEMKAIKRDGVPDEVQYTFILEVGNKSSEVHIWINDARDSLKSTPALIAFSFR